MIKIHFFDPKISFSVVKTFTYEKCTSWGYYYIIIYFLWKNSFFWEKIYQKSCDGCVKSLIFRKSQEVSFHYVHPFKSIRRSKKTGALPRLKGPSWTFMNPKMIPKRDPARLISGHPW